MRALKSLSQKERTIYPTDYWLEYLLASGRIAGEAGVPIRTLDKALWQASREGLVGLRRMNGGRRLRK